MIFKKLKIFTIFCLMFSAIHSKDQFDFEQKYQKNLEQFAKLTNSSSDEFMHQVPVFFAQFHISYQQIIKQLHQDIQTIHKEIKIAHKAKKSTASMQALHDQLKNLYNFIKKYRLQYEMIIFHETLKNYYQNLFQAIAQGQDVVPFLKDFDIQPVNYENLKYFAKRVTKDLRKIETYEYRLHADWVDIKLQNYVLKIELIRLRNAILFHPLYKKTKLKLSSSYPR